MRFSSASILVFEHASRVRKQRERTNKEKQKGERERNEKKINKTRRKPREVGKKIGYLRNHIRAGRAFTTRSFRANLIDFERVCIYISLETVGRIEFASSESSLRRVNNGTGPGCENKPKLILWLVEFISNLLFIGTVYCNIRSARWKSGK